MSRFNLKIAALVVGGVFFLAVAASEDVKRFRGEWSLNNWSLGNSVQVKLTRRAGNTRWSWSNGYPIDDLKGLDRDQLHAGHANVAFAIVRDAGTFKLEGSIVMGIGSGDFTFEPDPGFASKLAQLGYDPIEEGDLLPIAIRDISLAYAAEVKQAGLARVDVGDLVRFQDHGVELEFIQALSKAQTPGLTADDVVNLGDHGVDGEYVRGMKRSGYRALSAAEMIELHDHGVDAEFVSDLVKAGMAGISIDEIVELRDHGVEPDYVARIHAAGFKDLSVAQIVKLHDHGVD